VAQSLPGVLPASDIRITKRPYPNSRLALAFDAISWSEILRAPHWKLFTLALSWWIWHQTRWD